MDNFTVQCLELPSHHVDSGLWFTISPQKRPVCGKIQNLMNKKILISFAIFLRFFNDCIFL
uniref:Uncharacterized protein n=1 Tax=Anguilla anguilla TaxID=7936 RepID=A0A0E9WGB4_ANGAN